MPDPQIQTPPPLPGRPLGTTMRDVLRSLVEHGSWSPGCGWTWTNRSTTERVLQSLVRRGCATVKSHPWGDEYHPTEVGENEAVRTWPSLRAKVERRHG